MDTKENKKDTMIVRAQKRRRGGGAHSYFYILDTMDRKKKKKKRSPLKQQSGHIPPIHELHLCTISVQRSPFWIVELVGHPFRFIKHVPFFLCLCSPPYNNNNNYMRVCPPKKEEESKETIMTTTRSQLFFFIYSFFSLPCAVLVHLNKQTTGNQPSTQILDHCYTYTGDPAHSCCVFTLLPNQTNLLSLLFSLSYYTFFSFLSLFSLTTLKHSPILFTSRCLEKIQNNHSISNFSFLFIFIFLTLLLNNNIPCRTSFLFVPDQLFTATKKISTYTFTYTYTPASNSQTYYRLLAFHLPFLH